MDHNPIMDQISKIDQNSKMDESPKSNRNLNLKNGSKWMKFEKRIKSPKVQNGLKSSKLD